MGITFHSGRFLLFKSTACIFKVGLIYFIVNTCNASEQYYFDPALLKIGNPITTKTDLSIFERSDMQPPGTYHVDIFLNKEFIGTRDVEFVIKSLGDGGEKLSPCFSFSEILAMGIKADLNHKLSDSKNLCIDISDIPDVSSDFVFEKQQLLLSVPQALVIRKIQDYIPPDQWDNGIPAFLLNYSANGSHSHISGDYASDTTSQYINFRPGINIYGWRLRNYTTWSHSSVNYSKWNSIFTYAQHEITSLKGQFSIGDSNSPSDIFDSLSFRGVQISSDEDMQPNSLKGYAPVVRGIARTNAQVTVRQNGYIVYQSYVPPGAFEFTDIYSTGGGGDLNVTIKEADGTEQHTLVPYTSLPILKRQGQFKYSVTGGLVRPNNEIGFIQGTAIYGLPWNSTLYGGWQTSEYYHSIALGIGRNISWLGALSVDVTHATSELEDKKNGQSWRFRYRKNIPTTSTDFTIAGSVSPRAGYYNMQDALNQRSYRSGLYLFETKRNRIEMTANQRLLDYYGALTLSFISETYWNSERRLQSVGVGYANSWNNLSYGLNYSFNRNTTANNNHVKDHILSFNISVPLNVFHKNTYANYNLNTSKRGVTTQTAGLNGTALSDQNLSWSVYTGHTNTTQSTSGGLNLDYRTTYGEAIGGYSYTSNSRHINYGFQGGVIVHDEGVTFGQPMGETVALLKAKGAHGVNVNNQTGVKTDWQGFAIVPYVSPYQRNSISLNTESLPKNAELNETNKYIVPSRGAVASINFQTQIGARALMTIYMKDGSPVPFGSIVSKKNDPLSQSFIVGDNGQVYLAGLDKKGEIIIRWGKLDAQKCSLSYLLPEYSDSDVIVLDGICAP